MQSILIENYAFGICKESHGFRLTCFKLEDRDFVGRAALRFLYQPRCIHKSEWRNYDESGFLDLPNLKEYLANFSSAVEALYSQLATNGLQIKERSSLVELGLNFIIYRSPDLYTFMVEQYEPGKIIKLPLILIQNKDPSVVLQLMNRWIEMPSILLPQCIIDHDE